jgi:hypothetical protein
MVELVVSLAAACAPTLAYLLLRFVFSKYYASNSASKLTGHKPATGFGSRLSRNDYALRKRPANEEDGDSEEEEGSIIVKEDIKMESQGNGRSDAHGWQVSDHSGDDGSLTSWYDDHRGKTSNVIYDGRQREESTRAWLSTEMSCRNGPNCGTCPEHAIRRMYGILELCKFMPFYQCSE